ncbi:hypothetical protein KC222_18985 [Cedecea davisae]|uniref:Uncharacterized protein n=1 Tax=Cedecea davisae TaxID=158484 RepID=A0ABS6DMR4_9ENTR|nr:hypothetical protein [Cedecea davisae]MBU4684089.1 hypothetical protein [Cedecea davisae]MBU4689065.1 hypothetical protein [Cedecea davisae]
MPKKIEFMIISDNPLAMQGLKALIFSFMPRAIITGSTLWQDYPTMPDDSVRGIILVASDRYSRHRTLSIAHWLHNIKPKTPQLLLHSEANSVLASLVPQRFSLKLSASLQDIAVKIAHITYRSGKENKKVPLTQTQGQVIKLLEHMPPIKVSEKLGINIKKISRYKQLMIAYLGTQGHQLDYQLINHYREIKIAKEKQGEPVE